MNKFSPQKTTAFLKSESQELQNLFARIKELQTLNQLVVQFLPSNLRPYCQVTNLTGSHLTLLVANGSVATQIRFQSNDLLKQFKQHPSLAQINDIYCKVRPLDMKPKTAASSSKDKMPPLSQETAEMVHDMAEGIQDADLKEIMQRIASRVKK